MTRATPALELDRLRRAYGAVVALEDVSLSLEKGEFLTLLGPSGSGKTTTLRLIGGFEAPDGGEIRINGAPAQHLPPYLRDTATIFQSGALFPHKTVADNIAFGLRMRGMPRDEIGRRITEALDIVRLAGKEDRYPEQLSGGQRQRVALARSLAVRPAVLLFDEPLSALDLSLRLLGAPVLYLAIVVPLFMPGVVLALGIGRPIYGAGANQTHTTEASWRSYAA